MIDNISHLLSYSKFCLHPKPIHFFPLILSRSSEIVNSIEREVLRQLFQSLIDK